jgi:hypothetical protein
VSGASRQASQLIREPEHRHFGQIGKTYFSQLSGFILCALPGLVFLASITVFYKLFELLSVPARRLAALLFSVFALNWKKAAVKHRIASLKNTSIAGALRKRLFSRIIKCRIFGRRLKALDVTGQ